jgi:hypothetical protein
MKKIQHLFLIMIFIITTSACSTDENLIQDSRVTMNQENTTQEQSDGSGETDRWDQYFLLPEKDFIYLAKNENMDIYSKFDYETWDEYLILKYMSNKCVDSYTFPYGFMSAFFDTSKATDTRSAIISYVCVASAGRGLINTIFLETDEKENTYTTDNLVTDDYDFGFEMVKKVGNDIDFLVLDGDTRETKGEGRISFEKGKPIVKFTSSDDDFIDKYIMKHGSIFDEKLWRLGRT